MTCWTEARQLAQAGGSAGVLYLGTVRAFGQRDVAEQRTRAAVAAGRVAVAAGAAPPTSMISAIPSPSTVKARNSRVCAAYPLSCSEVKLKIRYRTPATVTVVTVVTVV